MFRSSTKEVESLKWETFTGTVMADHVWSETHIRAKHFGSSQVRSTVVNRREFTLQADDGTQEMFQVNLRDVKVASGQLVSVVRASKNGGQSYRNAAVVNHSMRKTAYITRPTYMFDSHMLLALGTIPASVVGFLLWTTVPSQAGTGILLMLGNLVFIRTLSLGSALKAKTMELCKRASAEHGHRVLKNAEVQSTAA